MPDASRSKRLTMSSPSHSVSGGFNRSSTVSSYPFAAYASRSSRVAPKTGPPHEVGDKFDVWLGHCLSCADFSYRTTKRKPICCI